MIMMVFQLDTLAKKTPLPAEVKSLLESGQIDKAMKQLPRAVVLQELLQRELRQFLSNPDAVALLKSGTTLVVFSGTINGTPFTYLTTAGLRLGSGGGKGFIIYDGKPDEVSEIGIPFGMGGGPDFVLKNGSKIRFDPSEISANAYVSAKEPDGKFAGGEPIKVEFNPPSTAFEKFSVKCREIVDMPVSEVITLLHGL